MSQDEDRILEGVLEGLDGGATPVYSTVDDHGLRREYQELAGLLPYALDPVVPRAEVKAALMARIEPPAPAQPLAFPTPRPSPRQPPVMMALVAVFGLLTVGLTAFSAFLYQETQRQGVAIADVRATLEQGRERERALLVSQSELGRLRSLVGLASTRVCHLRPPSEDPAQPVAKALVYFHRARREYFLVAHDLAPCKEGTIYRLWFMVDGRPVGGTSFHVKAGVPVTIGSDDMPEGATAILLTLGMEGGEEPDSQAVLYGDQSEEML